MMQLFIFKKKNECAKKQLNKSTSIEYWKGHAPNLYLNLKMTLKSQDGIEWGRGHTSLDQLGIESSKPLD